MSGAAAGQFVVPVDMHCSASVDALTAGPVQLQRRRCRGGGDMRDRHSMSVVESLLSWE